MGSLVFREQPSNYVYINNDPPACLQTAAVQQLSLREQAYFSQKQVVKLIVNIPHVLLLQTRNGGGGAKVAGGVGNAGHCAANAAKSGAGGARTSIKPKLEFAVCHLTLRKGKKK